jgi:uncharacterized protein (DUF2336 family)
VEEKKFRLPDPGDVEALLALAKAQDTASRGALYQSVWDLCVDQPRLDARERRLALDILRQLAHDVEMSLRVRLAEDLATYAAAPRDLILFLLDERIEIAGPILINSQILTDNDLIAVIRKPMRDHRMAVARRPRIGESVSAALVDTGEQDVIVALLDNHTAQIGTDVLARLTEASRDIVLYQGPLLKRPDMPLALAERMYVWVGQALRQEIVRRYQIPWAILEHALDDAIESDLALHRASDDLSAQLLIDKLAAAGQLSVAYLVRALREGEMALFEHGFAKLSGLSPAVARAALYEQRPHGLALACAAMGIDRAVFFTILQMTRREGGDIGLRPKEISEYRRFYDSLDAQTACRALAEWQETPETPIAELLPAASRPH